MKALISKIKFLLPMMLILSMIASGCTPATTTPATPTTPAATQLPPTTAPVSSPTPTVNPTADELVIAIPEDLGSYDPYFAQGDLNTPAIMKMLFDNLIERDTQGILVPGLATSWNWVDDKTLELKLRSGVKFHNGQDFSSEDVLFSIQRMIDPANKIPVANGYGSIDSVEAVDSLTVRIHTKQVDSQLINNLTTFLAILPKATFDQMGADAYALAPIGTGPYKFVQHERDQFVKLTVNPYYFDGSYKGKAIVPNLTFRIIPELATQLAELQTGTIDIATGVTNDKVAGIQATQGLYVATGQGTTYYMLPFAFKAGVQAPYDNIQVRQALAYGTDVKSILDSLGGGYGTLLAGPFTSITTGYDPSIQPWPYDKAKALELLAAAGYSKGLTLTIDVASNFPSDIIQAIVGQWTDIGVTLNINSLEVGKFNEKWMGKQNSDMLAVSFNVEVEPGSFQFVWTCKGVISYYCNNDFESAYNQGVSLLDDTQRAAAFRRSYQILHDDLPAIYLWSTSVHWGVSNKVITFANSFDGSLIPSLMNKVK